ncbi:hypothetical protein [Catellatospora chokoriensis]|uniref:Uncharacterized protein n=1 Tax=Catellatospora chokoriensis TaxID=310353 RepID=A0A8J3NVN7_9ACTN|nr:hypothetical protein [Catellatospora chokoriensis]GIF94138.1 hypothetical protein Cch02nite_75820 [Catellatospora chokoriensis]
MTVELRLKRRVDALFKAMSSDFLLREQFVTDPAQVFYEYVDGERPSAEVTQAANQLTYAVLSHPPLLQWLRDYASGHPDMPPEDVFAKDFSRAVARHGDDEVVLALVRGGGQREDTFRAQSALLKAIISAVGSGRGVFAGTEMSPGGGTEMSPGTGGTEMSPGVLAAGGGVFAGTEMSPGGGTEMSPGTGGTEMSPGVARMVSPDVQVTLDALTQFAKQMRASGALRVSGLG